MSTLEKNHDKKVIIYSNTAVSIESMKVMLETWIDHSTELKCDIVGITGDLEPELKLAYTELFTQAPITEENVTDLTFNPRILLATASCIGAGLDSSDVFTVIRVGFPSSLLDLVQEMGRCGRGRVDDGMNPSDEFILIFNLYDYMYMLERIYSKEINDESTNKKEERFCNKVISEKDKKKQQQEDLLDLLKVLTSFETCYHYEIENVGANPMLSEERFNSSDACGNACPICKKQLSNFMLPIKKEGVQNFLIHTFISSPPTTGITAKDMLTRLKTYEDVGKVVYGRPHSNKPPDAKYLHWTILQLIASSMAIIKISEDDSKGIFQLGMQTNSPYPIYLLYDVWKYFKCIE